MIGASVAIGDFMLMLLSAVVSTALGLLGWGLLGIGAAGGLALAARRLVRYWH